MSLEKKKYLITTQKRERLAVQQKSSAFFKHCEKCNRKVEMMTLDAITFHTGRSTREIFRLIETDCLHSIETVRGHLLVCTNSLQTIDEQKLIGEKKTR